MDAKPFVVMLVLALSLVPAVAGAVGNDGPAPASAQEAPCEAILPKTVCDTLEAAGGFVREEVQRLVRCLRYGVC